MHGWRSAERGCGGISAATEPSWTPWHWRPGRNARLWKISAK